MDLARVPYLEVSQSDGNVKTKTKYQVSINRFMRWKADHKIYYGSVTLRTKNRE